MSRQESNFERAVPEDETASAGPEPAALAPLDPAADGELPAAASRRERNWAAVAHASVVVTVALGLASGGLAALLGLAIPAVIWYFGRGRSTYVAEQAQQATLFQLTGLVCLLVLAVGGSLALVVGWVVAAALSIVLIGLVLVPIMLLLTAVLVALVACLPVAQIVYGCYGAVEARKGRPFRYRWVSALRDRYPVAA